MPLGREVGLRPSDVVLDRNPAPQKGSRAPQFAAHVYYGQTAACIKMPLGMELGLGPGQIMLDGDPAPPRERGTAAPCFRPMSIVATVAISATAELLFLYPLVGPLVGLGPKFLDNGYKPSLNGSPRNLHTSLMWGSSLENYLRIFFTSPLKNLAGKTSNVAELQPTRCQSEARNFETAQHIDKQKCAKMVRNLGPSPPRVFVSAT